MHQTLGELPPVPLTNPPRTHRPTCYYTLLPQARFKHEPSSPHGFVGAALSSNVIHITKEGAGGWGL